MLLLTQQLSIDVRTMVLTMYYTHYTEMGIKLLRIWMMTFQITITYALLPAQIVETVSSVYIDILTAFFLLSTF